MLDMVVQSTGVLFLYAVAAEFVVVFVEQAGAALKQDEETKPGGAPALALAIVTTLTPGLLLLHGYLSTESAYRAALAAAAVAPTEAVIAGFRAAQIAAVGAPIVAVIVGAILGRILGSASQGAARVLRGVVLPLALAAFALTIYATWPSIGMLVENFTEGSVRLPPAG